MSPEPEWLCTDPDDVENVLWLGAPDEAGALRQALAECPDVEWEIERITPAMRRRWRYHERKEEGTLPPRKSRAKVPSAEAEAWYRGLGMMGFLSLERDEAGRLRCDQCHRFVTIDDLAGARTSAIGGGMCLDFAPSCRRCRGVA